MLQKLLAEGYAMLERNVFANITGGTSGSFGNVIGNIGNIASIGIQPNAGFGNLFNNILK